MPHPFQRWIEGQAFSLRTKCDLGPFERLDPFVLAEKMDIEVIGPSAIANLEPETLSHLLGAGARTWSGGTLQLPSGSCIVVLNPTHDDRRQSATLMEELVHVHLKHEFTQLRSDGTVTTRTYKKSVEQQAYGIGAAALLPSRVLKGARTLGKTILQVADEHLVSVDLVRFRQNLLGIRLQDDAVALAASDV